MAGKDRSEQVKLHADLERAALDGYLAGVPLGRGSVVPALSIDAATLDKRTLELSRIAFSLLPLGQLTPAQQQAYAARGQDGLRTYVQNTAEALRLCPQVATEARPEQLTDLLAKKAAYEGFSLLGKRLQNSGMDLRLLVGTFLWFLIERVMGALETRLAAPETTPQKRERLLDDFAPALLCIDRLLRYPQERKAELARRRSELGQEAADAEADAQLAEVILQLKQKLPVERETLLAAARRHLELRGSEAAAPPAEPPSPAPGAGTPRRLVQ